MAERAAAQDRQRNAENLSAGNSEQQAGRNAGKTGEDEGTGAAERRAMITLTDRQAAGIVADLERLLRSAKDLRSYNTTRKILLTLKKKQRNELLHSRKGR
jgi:hypothetical protein